MAHFRARDGSASRLLLPGKFESRLRRAGIPNLRSWLDWFFAEEQRTNPVPDPADGRLRTTTTSECLALISRAEPSFFALQPCEYHPERSLDPLNIVPI